MNDDGGGPGVTWQFQRLTTDAGDVAIHCHFVGVLPGGIATQLDFMLPEDAAIGMRNDLSQVLSGITIAHSIDEAGRTP